MEECNVMFCISYMCMYIYIERERERKKGSIYDITIILIGNALDE